MRCRRILTASLLALALIGLGTALALRPSTKPWPHLPVAEPVTAELSIRFLGTSSLSISDGTDTVLIDAYLSRPGLFELLFRPLNPNKEAIQRHLERADLQQASALLIAHGHFDHALDAVPVANRLQARLMGSQTLSHLAARHAEAPRVEVLGNGRMVQVGDFAITPYVTPHSPGDLAKGARSETFHPPARARDWPMGEAYAFAIQHGSCRFLVVPSAGEIGPRLKGVEADVIFLGIGQLSRQGSDGTAAYWRDTVRASGARLVIPVHWDDFTRPLDEPLRPLPYALDRFDLTMKRLSQLAEQDQVELRLPPTHKTLNLQGLGVEACA
jgi:L-ascorbate metabolism protein UlaG (beta-lactamase superfamily)